jgi:hypothetical protein
MHSALPQFKGIKSDRRMAPGSRIITARAAYIVNSAGATWEASAGAMHELIVILFYSTQFCSIDLACNPLRV